MKKITNLIAAAIIAFASMQGAIAKDGIASIEEAKKSISERMGGCEASPFLAKIDRIALLGRATAKKDPSGLMPDKGTQYLIAYGTPKGTTEELAAYFGPFTTKGKLSDFSYLVGVNHCFDDPEPC